MRVENKIDIPPPTEANLPSEWRDLSQDDVRTLLSRDPKPPGSSAAKDFADVIYRLSVKTAANKAKEGAGEDGSEPKRKERSEADVKKEWFEAVKDGDLEAVRTFIEDKPKGFDVNATDDVGNTALHLAARRYVKGDAVEMMRVLLEEGRADKTALDQHGRSAFELANELIEGTPGTDLIQGTKGVPGSERTYGKGRDFLKEGMNDEARLAVSNGDTERKDELLAAGADDPLKVGDVPKQEPTERVEEYKLLDELSLGERETSEEVDGKKLTVDQLATKTVLGKYKAGIDKKEIKEDDPRYKFYYAALAKSDTEGGRPIDTFYEQKNGAGTARRPGPSVDARPEDMKGIYDTGKLDEVMNDAFNSKEVSEDFRKAQDEALGKVPGLDKEDAKKRLKDMLLGEDFKNHLLTLQSDGKQAEAEAALQRGIGAYAMVASEGEVQEVTSTIGTIGLADQIEHYLTNLDQVDSEHWEQAVKDWVAMALTVTVQGHSATQAGMGVVKDLETKDWLKKILEDREARKELAKVLGIVAREPNNIFEMRGANVNEPSALRSALDRAYEQAKTPLAERNAITKGLTELNKAGALGASMGVITLAATARQMTNGTAFGDDHKANLQIAGGLMFAISCIPEMAQLIEKGVSYPGLTKLLGGTGNRTGTTAAIMNASSLQEIFGVKPKGDIVEADPKFANSKWYNDWVYRLSDKLGGNAHDLGKKAAWGVTKVLTAPAYAGFGMTLIGSGGLTAKEGADEGNAYKTAAGALQVVAGTAFTGAGTAWTLETLGNKRAAPWMPRLTIAGVAPAFFAQVVGVLAEVDKPSRDQHKYLKTMDKLGVLQEGWGDKVDFLIKSFWDPSAQSGKGGRPKTAEGESVFDAYDWRKFLQDEGGESWSKPDRPDTDGYSRSEDHKKRVAEALERGDGQAIADLLKDPPKGFKADEELFDHGRTALHHAVTDGGEHVDTAVETLVDAGRVDMARLDDKGRSAFQLAKAEAEKRGNPDIQQAVDFLLRKMREERDRARADGNDGRVEELDQALGEAA